MVVVLLSFNSLVKLIMNYHRLMHCWDLNGFAGLKVGNSACCGTGPFRAINSCGGKREPREFELCDNPNDYLLFDPFHPTEGANLQLAKLYWEGDSKVASPYNLKSMFQGMHNDIVQHTNLAARFMD